MNRRILGFLCVMASCAFFAACTTSSTVDLGGDDPDGGRRRDARVADGDGGPGADADPDPDLGPGVDASTFCDLPGLAASGVTVPNGFCVKKFATMPIGAPRVMAFAPNGDLFVASPREFTPGGAPAGPGAILVFPDDNHDGIADRMQTYMGLNTNTQSVHGLLFSESDGPNGSELWFTSIDAVYAVPYRAGDRQAPSGNPRKVADLSDPGVADRWTHTLSRSTAGTTYVSRGQYDNDTCPQPNRRGGAVLKIGSGHDLHGDIAITGLRNPMYTRCEPWGACYAAELSGDSWSGIGGIEKLVEIRDGDDFGYPCCVDRNMPNPFIHPPPNCASTGVAVQPFPLHDTPFGFDWEKGRWPSPYTNGFFVAQHGEVGSWNHTGIKWAPTDANTHRPNGMLRDFITGFSFGGPVRGRTTDLLFAPDGRMFFSDDQGQAIYWVAPRTLLR